MYAYREKEPDGSDLRTLVQLINQYEPRVLVRVIDQLADERDSDLIVSTAHKAKGRQWARVRIANDF